MAQITFLGGEETGDVAFVDWLGVRFHINQPVECDNAHIVAKARTNRFFRVNGEAAKPDPMAKARAARAAKRAAAAETPPKPGEGDEGSAAA